MTPAPAAPVVSLSVLAPSAVADLLASVVGGSAVCPASVRLVAVNRPRRVCLSPAARAAYAWLGYVGRVGGVWVALRRVVTPAGPGRHVVSAVAVPGSGSFLTRRAAVAALAAACAPLPAAAA